MEFDDYGTIIGYFDFAQLSLYLFWLFFAGLIIYLQRENMREGYPLENDDGTPAGNGGPFPLPSQKTFKLPHNLGEVSVPNDHPVDDRPIALQQMPMSAGSPFEPTGDPMMDGVGPASWCMRADVPEYDGHGHAKIKPMRLLEDFSVVSWHDCRGLPVVSHDKQVIGRISDLWVDVPEQLVRYLEIELSDDGGKRLAPIQLVKITSDRVKVHSLYAQHFPNIPQTASDGQVTKLEEEKICGYWCGGKLYATPERLESQL
ncbi:MAG: photosynthetic reaction center subunit H [Pseudomonadota bacterium]